MKALETSSDPPPLPLDVVNQAGDYPAVMVEEAQAAEVLARAAASEAAPLQSAVAGSVARNTLIMLVAQLITFALTFTWTVVLQHMLGDANYGKLFAAQSLAWIGAVFMDAGVSTYLTKQVARDHEHTRRLLATAYGLRLGSTVLIYGVILGVAVAL